MFAVSVAASQGGSPSEETAGGRKGDNHGYRRSKKRPQSGRNGCGGHRDAAVGALDAGQRGPLSGQPDQELALRADDGRTPVRGTQPEFVISALKPIREPEQTACLNILRPLVQSGQIVVHDAFEPGPERRPIAVDHAFESIAELRRISAVDAFEPILKRQSADDIAFGARTAIQPAAHDVSSELLAGCKRINLDEPFVALRQCAGAKQLAIG